MKICHYLRPDDLEPEEPDLDPDDPDELCDELLLTEDPEDPEPDDLDEEEEERIEGELFVPEDLEPIDEPDPELLLLPMDGFMLRLLLRFIFTPES
jgi:hypothetical protein